MRRGRVRSRVVIGALGSVLVLLAGVATAGAAAAATTSGNLIRNGNGEAATGSPVPDWRLTTGTAFESGAYGTNGFPGRTDPGPPHRGKNLLAGGADEALEVATQSRSLTAYAAAIAAGTATYSLGGYLGGYSDQNDNATLSIRFTTTSGTALTTAKIGPVTATDRAGASGLLHRTATGPVPTGAAKVTVTLTLTRTDGSYDDGYADNLSLTVTTA